MPVGLDGNPDPVVTTVRMQVLGAVADAVEQHGEPRVLVGIDGRSGSGKSTFADELGRILSGRGHSVVRSTTDLFHRPRSERMRLGPSSPDGYLADSHQIEAIEGDLLAPFRAGATVVRVGAFDEPSDSPYAIDAAVPERAVLVFDGLFVHRHELQSHWDRSVFLHADRRCDAAWLDYLEGGLPSDPTDRAVEIDRRLERARWPRYRRGWARYLESVGPLPEAMHIDNEDLEAPFLLPNQPSMTRP
jgi:uridine kinase